MTDGLETVVEFLHERHSGGNVQFNDLLLRSTTHSEGTLTPSCCCLLQLLLQLHLRQVRLLRQLAAQPLTDGLGELGFASAMMRKAFHLRCLPQLTADLLHIAQTDPEALRPLRLRAFGSRVGFQNPAS